MMVSAFGLISDAADATTQMILTPLKIRSYKTVAVPVRAARE
jgi:hypothetical protein